jgi:hypothetical protein
MRVHSHLYAVERKVEEAMAIKAFLFLPSVPGSEIDVGNAAQ